MADGEDSRAAQPCAYRGGREVPVVDSYRLEVDGQVFDVEVNGHGESHYSWVSGPNAGYGFGSSGPGVLATREQHQENIRTFLSMIDPATGYVSDS